jgi:hypothetical protein
MVHPSFIKKKNTLNGLESTLKNIINSSFITVYTHNNEYPY